MSAAATDEQHKLVVQIGQQDLLCRNQCGFYGNPEWGGYCSKCYRDYQHANKRSQHYNKNRSVPSPCAARAVHTCTTPLQHDLKIR